MTLYCVIDGKPIPDKWAHRRVTCSEECQAIYRREKRNLQAKRKCRLCGREFRNRTPRPPKAESLVLGFVRVSTGEFTGSSNG